MIECVIFDLDGTLLNTLEDLCDSTNYALSKFGYPERTLDEVRLFVGNGVRLLIERAIPMGKENPDLEECLKTFKNHYKENMYNKTAPYPQVLKLLQTLKTKKIKTAVVSNKFDLAVKELCKKYFDGLIDIAIGENEAEGIRKKPAPDSVFRVIKDLKIQTDCAIYVGDSETDIETAKNSGLDCVYCTWGFRGKDLLKTNKPRYVIDRPIDLLSVIIN